MNYDGRAIKVWHKEKLVADVCVQDGAYENASSEMSSLSSIRFYCQDNEKDIPISAVPPIIYSETLRDIGIAAGNSEAKYGDESDTYPVIEMRLAMARELLVTRSVSNVSLEFPYAHVSTIRCGGFDVHLGTGEVYKSGLGAFTVMPPTSHIKSRMFSPFFDSDPGTMEILAKILALSDEEKLKTDPRFLLIEI